MDNMKNSISNKKLNIVSIAAVIAIIVIDLLTVAGMIYTKFPVPLMVIALVLVALVYTAYVIYQIKTVRIMKKER